MISDAQDLTLYFHGLIKQPHSSVDFHTSQICTAYCKKRIYRNWNYDPR